MLKILPGKFTRITCDSITRCDCELTLTADSTLSQLFALANQQGWRERRGSSLYKSKHYCPDCAQDMANATLLNGGRGNKTAMLKGIVTQARPDDIESKLALSHQKAKEQRKQKYAALKSKLHGAAEYLATLDIKE